MEFGLKSILDINITILLHYKLCDVNTPDMERFIHYLYKFLQKLAILLW